MDSHAVVIAGGGPTGLMLAGELALAGVDAAVVERRASQDLDGLRAGGLQARTLEVLDQRGIVDRFLALGKTIRFAPFAGTTLDISDLPSRHNCFLALWQIHIERILADWVAELGVRVHRGREVTGFSQDEHQVDVELSGGEFLQARYLVACDGGRSLIRKKAGIDFQGCDPDTSYLIAEVDMTGTPERSVRRGEKGLYAIGKLEDSGRVRVVLNEGAFRLRGEPTIDDLREALNRIYGTDYGLLRATYLSRFTDMARQAVTYRSKRVLLAGDAAHVHSPVGGQGLNLGLQDAVNLGWKLARVLDGMAPESLLDTYHAERHPVAARVLRNTMALTALDRGDDRSGALREMMCELMSNGSLRRQYFTMLSGLDVYYRCSALQDVDSHPVVGRRMPDLDVKLAGGPGRVFPLLHSARPVFLNFGDAGSFDIGGWRDRVRLIDAGYDGVLELPAIGKVACPMGVLIRPDGYVAWAGNSPDGLGNALATWFGGR